MERCDDAVERMRGGLSAVVVCGATTTTIELKDLRGDSVGVAVTPSGGLWDFCNTL